MSYQVLARKWRPKNFANLVGQEHVVRALRHALEQKRLHHAYLFTGTRGVGKTTLARILAKCLNCETGITAEPCGTCGACLEIDAGRHADYVEMDAASNRGVEEMAQLLERAVYAPSGGRFKIYMIDEVHQLSGHAFNAMLKTLEEPPEHLKFILATTDPQKVPVTVLSRCLQFNLKLMPHEAIVGHLARILDSERIEYERGALPLLARAAAGSMRDALSLLDQAIAHGAGRVGAEGVRDMLGAVDQSYLFRLLDALAAGEGPALMAVADEMQARSLSFDSALQDLAGWLLRVALGQAAAGALPDNLPERERVLELGRRLDAESVQLYYQIALQGRSDLPLAPDEHAGFVMTLLRMLAFRPDVPATGAIKVPEKKSGSFDGDWPALARELPATGAAKELARHSELKRHAEGMFELAVPKSLAHLADKAYQDKLRAALEQHFGRPVKIAVQFAESAGETTASRESGEREARRAEAARAMQGDAQVRGLVDLFDGRVVDVRRK